jgi:hypothetical protein
LAVRNPKPRPFARDRRIVGLGHLGYSSVSLR